jgi:hypothetical protein
VIALIDGDILLYRIGFTTEQESLQIAEYRMATYIKDILARIPCDDYKPYLTDSKGNYRMLINPEYKGNRKQPKPRHYNLLKSYLINYHSAIIATGQEADDALGIEQTILGDDSIICSIDKDLLMIPGWHYNFVKDNVTYISRKEGLRHFYGQLLTGDPVDNVKGLSGIGPKKAAKILEGCKNEQEFKTAVFAAYTNKFPDFSTEKIRETIQNTGRLLWIRRQHGEFWTY